MPGSQAVRHHSDWLFDDLNDHMGLRVDDRAGHCTTGGAGDGTFLGDGRSGNGAEDDSGDCKHPGVHDGILSRKRVIDRRTCGTPFCSCGHFSNTDKDRHLRPGIAPAQSLTGIGKPVIQALQASFAAVTSTSTRNSGRVNPPTTISVEVGLGSSV